MNYTECLCSVLLNTGTGRNADDALKQAVGVIFQPPKADDGTFNVIPAGTVFNQAFWDGQVQNSDESKRMYPFMFSRLDDVDDTRAEPSNITVESGNRINTIKGVRTFAGKYNSAGVDVLKIMSSFECKEMQLYTVDRCGKLCGAVDANGDLRGMRVAKGSMYTILEKERADRAGGVMMSLEFDQILFDDKMLGYIDEADITADLLGTSGLIEVVPAVISASTTALVIQANTLSGAFDSKVPAEGLTGVADWQIVNETNDDVVTLDGAPIESLVTAGRYSFGFIGDPQTVADVLRIENGTTIFAKGFSVTDTNTTVA